MDRHVSRLLAVLLVVASFAASPQASTHIKVNIIAFDSHDQVIGDLTGNEFQVSDDGKSQRIISFHHEEPHTQTPVVILFDLLNDNLSNRSYGAEEIIQALEHLESSDFLYLYLLTNDGRLKPVRGLPNPQEEIPAETTRWTQHIRPLLASAIDSAYGLRQDYLDNGGLAFSAIDGLAESLKPFPGRKHLVWVTHAVPVLYSNRRGRRGRNERVYALSADNLGTTIDNDGVTFSSVYQGSGLGVENTDILKQFAQLTGGTVYHNDIHRAVNEAMAGSRSGYVIEYDAPQPDGKYHKIRVRCSRKGVRLQAKQGYYAN
jgi:VWFA-related protein